MDITNLILTTVVSIPCLLYIWLLLAWVFRKDTLKGKAKPDIYGQIDFYYPLKYVIFRVILWLRNHHNNERLKTKGASSDGAGYGVKSRNSPEEMDKVQTLMEGFPMAVDAVYFNGVNEEGAFLVAAIARRPENIVNTVLCLHLPGIGTFEMPNMPDTWLSDNRSKSAFTAGGLLITPVKCMEAWTIAYNGPMRRKDSCVTVHVNFNLKWTASTKIFDFDTDVHPHAMAAAIARQPWSGEFFATLKEAHQTHYEQFGEIAGDVHVDEYHHIKLQGVRDHSYGNIRDWRSIHRYVMNYAHLEDGTCVFVGTICMPSMLSRLDFGYVFHPDGSMDTAERSDFEFVDWGEDGNSPDVFEVNFIAGGKSYSMKCTKVRQFNFYMGKEWEAKIHERICRYTVNGVRGWGVSEWDYRNYKGKEAEAAAVEFERQNSMGKKD